MTGIGTLGSVSNTTTSLSSPVGIAPFVLGHLVRIGGTAFTRSIPVFAALSAQHLTAQARSVRNFKNPKAPFDVLTVRGASCSSACVEQARPRPSGRSVHGICDGIPDCIAFTIADILKRASFFSSQFARCTSMTSL